MKENTLVSVLMPVFNAEKYLSQSIESILNQTYAEFNFYIVNDGSTDSSEKIILSYKDERIIYLKNETNKGLIYSLNKGFEIIQSKYIVRMDADDISMPERIQKQFEFMETNQEIWVSGTQIQYFGEANHQSDFPLTHDLINARLLFGSSIVHPSVIIRMDQLKKNKVEYDEKYLHTEDYELWTRIARIGKLANLKDVLLKYRMEGQNITINNWNSREERLVKIYTKFLNELEVEPTKENIQLHLELSGNTTEVADLLNLKKYSDHLIFKNGSKLIYNQTDFKQIISECWSKLFFKVVNKGFIKTMSYWKVIKSVSWNQVRYLIGMYRLKIFK